MIHIKNKYKTIIRNGKKARIYEDNCPTCGVYLERRVDRVGKDCVNCRNIKLSKKRNTFSTEISAQRKRQVREKTRRAIKNGRIKKLPCQVCGNIKSQAHHQDYNKWFEIAWLCRRHHLAVHSKRGAYQDRLDHPEMESKNEVFHLV